MVANQCRATRGFTLVEILAVVVILGIAAGVILPQLGSRDDLKAAAGARVLMADLIYAQNRAIATQTWQYVKFNMTAGKCGSYSILSALSPAVVITQPITHAAYTQTPGAGGSTGLTDITISSVSFDGNTTIGFDTVGAPYSVTPAGVTAALGVGSIVIACNTFTLTASVEPYTGEISVK